MQLTGAITTINATAITTTRDKEFQSNGIVNEITLLYAQIMH